MKTDDPPPMRSGVEARSVEARPQPMARRPTIFIFLLWPPQRYSASCRPLRHPSQFVIPAKAGIQGRGMRGENDPPTPPPTSALNLPVSSFRPPTSSFRRRPESRRGGVGQDRHTIGKNPAPHHRHPLMRPSQGNGDSLGGGDPGEVRGRHQSPYLGVPAPAGKTDCCKSMSRIPLRDRRSNRPRGRFTKP